MNNRTRIIIEILACLFIGVIILYTCNHSSKQSSPVTKEETKALVKKVEQAEQAINPKIDSLNRVIISQNDQLDWLNSKLNTSDNTIAALKLKQAQKAKNIPTNEAFTEENKQEFLVEMETLDTERDNRDSLCDSAKKALVKIVSLKDSVIAKKDYLYANLRNQFDTAIQNNYSLIAINKQLGKKIKRKKLENGILKVAGVAAAVLILKK